MNPRVTLAVILGAALTVSLIAAVFLAVRVSALDRDLASAKEQTAEAIDQTAEAEEDTAEVLDDLETTQAKLKKARRSLRNALAAASVPSGTLQEQLENGTAVPVQGLSASLPRRFWSCLRWTGNDCHSLEDDVVFKNKTQVGSAVTCLFRITYEDQSTTTFAWSSSYVPPGGGTDTGVLYFYSDYSSPLDLLGPTGDCYRGSATYIGALGD